VVRALALLCAFEEATELSVAQLAERTGVPKPTVVRLAGTLENAGMLVRAPGRHSFVLGPRLVSLARLVLTRGLPELARPYLETLARRFGHSVNLAVLDSGEMLFLDVIESRSSLRMASALGAREPVHATAVGKAVAARLPGAELDALLASRPLRAFTQQTITSRAQFDRELAAVRARGYAIDRGESIAGARCIAAEIISPHGVAGAISISAAVEQLPEDDFEVIGPAVRWVADEVSAALGAA
jgi:IclR family acetate operon transcriptional repressor